MKRLQRYYFYIGIPILLVILGSIVFFPQIAGTVRGNPHPQINYVIFGLIIFGCAQMLFHVWRINREGRLLENISDILLNDQDHSAAVDLMKANEQRNGRYDVADVLDLLLAIDGNAVGHVLHAAVQSEVERFQVRQNRRLLLAQYMAGMMVGMGLLGTFIGLLGALGEIGKLIGSFAFGSGTVSDSIAAISGLVTRLTAPMKAMGVAFSASLFGVLGSLIMGVLMVSVKEAAGDLISMLEARVSRIIDIGEAKAEGSLDGDMHSLNHAINELSHHSPIIKSLAIALDQSERRVRQMLTATSQLMARIDINTQTSTQILDMINKTARSQSLGQETLEQVHRDFAKMLQIQTNMGRHSEQFALATVQQQQHLETLQNTQETKSKAFLQQQTELAQQHQSLWHEQATILRSHSELMNEVVRTIRTDSLSRTEFVHQLQLQLTENQARQEQILHTLTNTITKFNVSKE